MNNQPVSPLTKKKKHFGQLLAHNSNKSHWIRAAYFLFLFLSWFGIVFYLLKKIIPKSKPR